MKTLAVDGKKQKKATRQRKKSKLNEIRKQIEFYFSDANLSKNRFMKTLLDQSEYVPFTVLMTFNRLKEMSATQEEVVKSLTKSTMVEVSPDEQSLRRTTEIVIKEDADDYTIYIVSNTNTFFPHKSNNFKITSTGTNPPLLHNQNTQRTFRAIWRCLLCFITATS